MRYLYSRLSPLLCALVSTFLVLLFLETRIDPDMVGGLPVSAVISDRSDDYGMIVHTLANWPQRNGATMLAVGGSAMREGLPPAPDFEATLTSALHRAIIYRNLSGYAQTMTESLRIIDYLARQNRLGSGDVVLLHVNPFRLSKGRKELLRDREVSRIPLLDNSATVDLLREMGFETAWQPRVWPQRYAARRFILGRLSRPWQDCVLQVRRLSIPRECIHTFIGVPAVREPEAYVQYAAGRVPVAHAERMAEVSEIQDRAVQIEANIPFSAQVVRRIHEIVSARGAKLILVELPRDPLSEQAYASVDRAYSAAIHSLQAVGALYVDLRDPVRFPASAFYDLDHPLPQTRGDVAQLLLNSIRTQVQN